MRINARHTALMLTAGILAWLGASTAFVQSPPPASDAPDGADGAPRPHAPRPRRTTEKRGLIQRTDAATGGYRLFSPLMSTKTYLVDQKGATVHTWPSKYTPGQAVYLLEDGSLLRTAREPENRHFGGGGIGGRVERLAPDGKVLWEFVYADEQHCQHHDIEPLPNGHVLLIAWERKSKDDVLAAGANPELFTGDELWPDSIVEVAPEGTSGGKIVWEWHVWDHLVQEFDDEMPNYGVVAEHPERIDLNYRRNAPRESPEEMQRLRGLGYVGGAEDDHRPRRNNNADRRRRGPGGGPDMRADWCHTNSVAYNAQLDQIVLSVHEFNEIWIIDHSTTTQEASGHTGGRSGKGGDLLYRWGNPRVYGAGTAADQQLFAQHDARWIPAGSPGAGHLTVFNNGTGRPGAPYSSIIEIAPPVDAQGHYTLVAGEAFGPAQPTWEYTAADKPNFFSSHISGAERLPNGHTLICAGEEGRIFEVTAGGETVWDYVNPHVEMEGGPLGPFAGLFGAPPRRPDGQRPQGEVGDGPPGGEARPRGQAPVNRPQSGNADEDGSASGTEGNAQPPERRRPVGPPDGTWGPPGGDGRRRPPGGPWGPPGGGPGRRPGGPGGPGGGVFRAGWYASDFPGVRAVLSQTKGDTTAAAP